MLQNLIERKLNSSNRQLPDPKVDIKHGCKMNEHRDDLIDVRM